MRRPPIAEPLIVGEFTLRRRPQGGARVPAASPNAISPTNTRPSASPNAAAYRPTRSAASRASSPKPRSTRRSRCRSLDRHARPRAHRNARPPGLDARDARHQRARNGFHTCRTLHLLQMLLGAIDTPGSFRYQPPYPKPMPPANRPGKTRKAERRARRGPARLRARARRSARRRERRAAPHRQGVLVGAPARRARHAAERDPQRVGRRSRTASTRCSCSWRTWAGTRR